MNGLIDDDSKGHSSIPASFTRRERRIARSRARRTAAIVGWFGYGVGVFVVVTAAAWLAVRGETPAVPQRISKETVVSPVVVVRPPSSTTSPSLAPVVAPVDAAIPTTTTSTTTDPVLSAAVTPAPEPSTP